MWAVALRAAGAGDSDGTSDLDLAPKGRDEDGLRYSMSWLRLHDKYEQP